MSELAIQIKPETPAAARAVPCIEVADATKRLNQSGEWIRARCRLQWQPRGLVRLETPAGGGKARWLISPDADPALALVKIVELPAINLRRLTQAQRDEHAMRLSIYARWQEACRAAIRTGSTNERGTELFLQRMADEGLNFTHRTLDRWHKLYRKTGSLVKRSWQGRRVAEGDNRMRLELRRLWMTQAGLSMQLCWEMARERALEREWAICSYRTAARYLKKIPAAERILAREGPKAFTAKAEPSIERYYSTLESNEIQNADNHIFDVIVKVGERTDRLTGEVTPIYGRPWLTAWQDLRSRKIVGWVIRAADPNTDAILEALRRAMMAHGAPFSAYTDLGRDYLSQILCGQTRAMYWKRRRVHVEIDAPRLEGIYTQLGIKHLHTWPYHGQSKPIERFFGTLEDRFGRTFDTYCGRNPQEKPERLAAMLERGKAPLLADFIAAFGDWLETDYH